MRLSAPWRTPRHIGFLTGGVIFAVVTATLSWPLFAFGETGYTAEFSRAAGLQNGDEVRIAGIAVGKVRGIELDGDHVDVRFSIEDDIELGSNTRAEVKLATLLGSTFLDVEPAGTGTLDDGVIPRRNTFTTFQIQEVVEGATDATEQLDGKAVREALKAVAETLPKDGKALGSTLDGLSRLASVVTGRDEELDELLQSATSVAAILQSHGGEVTTLMKQADVLLRAILARKQAVHDILVHVRGMSTSLRAMLGENSADVKPLLDRLTQITTVLRKRDTALDRGFKILGPMSRYLTNATGNGPYIDFGVPYPAPDNTLCAAGIAKGCR